ncbi:MAG: trypsin-like peptidase domain-containing protein [Planctomycetota bacterium]
MSTVSILYGCRVTVREKVEGQSVNLAAIERRVATVAKKTRPAIVRISWKPTGTISRGGIINGVIVSADGHIATLGQHGLPAGKTVNVYLLDGRRLKGEVLGSYWSWDIGLMKINDKGPWPHVEFGNSAEVRPGDVCISVGYPSAQSENNNRARSPRVVRILRLAASWWLCSSCQFFSGDEGDSLFDLEGRLIGIHSKIYVDKIFNPAIEVFKRYWDDLIAGRQIDGLVPVDSSEATTESGTIVERLADAIARARSATVRLVWGDKETDRVSGVIVTQDGYIATCQHHWREPKEAVTVYLADGRTVAGKVLGSNPFCDIGLMKLTEKGPWPHVEFGSSLNMKRGDMSILVGYPFAPVNDGMLAPRRTPAVRLGFVVEGISRKAGVGVLSTSCFNLSGDSGSGVFDLQGRLVAIHTGAEDYEGPAYHTRIEVLQKQWDFLTTCEPLESPN